MQQRALAEATELLRDVIDQDPNNILANFNLIQLLSRQGLFDEAQAVVDELIQVDPEAKRKGRCSCATRWSAATTAP